VSADEVKTKRFTILDWSEEDRPREKLIQKGKSALSDAELIAILLGSGLPNMSAVDVGKLMLQSADNDLAALAKQSLKQLTKIKGIGPAKAITVMAALELGRRRKDQETPVKVQVTKSRDGYEYMYRHFADLEHEEFNIILLRRNNTIIRYCHISKGGVAGTLVDAKLIFRPAIEELASGIILCHNHPSGNLQPSQADIDLTAKLKKAGETLDISVLDHLIFTNESYYSFADNGLI
jgi:DNA repair protein RadC